MVMSESLNVSISSPLMLKKTVLFRQILRLKCQHLTVIAFALMHLFSCTAYGSLLVCHALSLMIACHQL
jgi:hypothetical protein